MKKIVILIILALVFMLTSCTEDEKKLFDNDTEITLTYVIDGVTLTQTKEKDFQIRKIEDIPQIDNKEYLGLFIDPEFTERFPGGPITDDLTIYIKTKKTIQDDIPEDVKNTILVTYLEMVKADGEEKATIDEVHLHTYLGSYNNTYILILDYDKYAYLQWVASEKIANIIIERPNSNPIRAWHNGVFYTLQEAYDNQFLTISDLLDIATCERYKFYAQTNNE